MDRREFLKTLGAIPLVLLAPPWLRLSWAAESAKTKPERDPWQRTLLLLELHGGNDGLNTVIPYGDPRYYQVRPRLAIPREQVKRLTPELGLHPALEPLMPLWEAKELAVVAGVGYDHPNRSHFRSIEIWETGSESEQTLDEGWLSRLFDRHPLPDNFTAEGIVLGRGEAGPLAGGRSRIVTLQDPAQFLRQAELVRPVDRLTTNRALAHILEVQREIARASGDLELRLEQAAPPSVPFPGTRIGKQLEIAATLMSARVPAAVIKVTHGSFDTHAGQLNHHQRLLQELAEALIAFRANLRQAGLWDRVLVMTYSEFGRRVAENGSQGTDHGTAAPHFFMGGRVKGGLYGSQPSLADLQAGDLKHRVDYRSLYNTVIQNWWGLRSNLFDGPAFPPLGCIS
jgi:uncharacterized protein (DUF1501 family)